MFEEVPPLQVLPFFSIHADLHSAGDLHEVQTQNKYILPSFSSYLDEEEFAQISMGWSDAGIYIHVEVDLPFVDINPGDPQKGDSLEFFLDTRDLKDSRFISQFCHHFVFFPEKAHGYYGKEITRFRTEQVHSLCDPKDLLVRVHYGKKRYVMDIEIMQSALYGFDPQNFQRLGFTYRINRKDGPSQHFAISSSECKFEQLPSFWATLDLV